MERRISVGWALRGLFFAGIALGGFWEAWAACGSAVSFCSALAPAAVEQRAAPAMPIPGPAGQQKEEEAGQKEKEEKENKKEKENKEDEDKKKEEEKENKENQESDGGVDVFVPPPREVMKNLYAAQRLLEQGRLSEAVGFLQALLTHPEDYFFQPDPARPTRRSLKSEAQHLLGQLPEEARQMYELRYGPQARQLLRQAVAEGDPEKLSEISRTFYHTEAGYEATLLLGLHHLRSGRVLAAALVLDRLRQACAHPERWEPTLSLALATAWYRAKMPEQAQAVLVRLKAAQGGKPRQLAGGSIAWFNRDQEALSWLSQWAGRLPPGPGSDPQSEYLMVRNNPARNAAGSGSRPLLNLRWRVPSVDHPMLEQWIQRLQQDWHDQGVPCMSLGIPLAVGNTVLMRTLENLVAVDLQTGKRLWESPIGTPVDTILAGQDRQIDLGQATALQLRMAQRLWLDATYSRMSSDGKLVFCVEADWAWERPLSPGMPPILIIRQRMKEGRSTLPGNRLVAYDIRTGKLQWEVGGPEDQEYTLPLAGTAFLGPPLPLMGQLYVLGETRNEIRLWVLEAQTGRLIWSQQLGVGGPMFDLEGQPVTGRFLGLSPSYAEGILVCPTGRGALVALDLANRTFLWAYAYLPQMEASQRRMLLVQRMMPFAGQMAPVPTDGWRETTCILADGRAIFTTPESPEIYCLDLADGKELWKQSCPDGLYVACVHEGKVVWVGRRRLGAFRLADGQAPWPAENLAKAAPEMPSVGASSDSLEAGRLGAKIVGPDAVGARVVGPREVRPGAGGPKADVPGDAAPKAVGPRAGAPGVVTVAPGGGAPRVIGPGPGGPGGVGPGGGAPGDVGQVDRSGDAMGGGSASAGRFAVDLPDGAVPSGLGFLSGDKYYLPLSTGEVATVDLTKGEIIHRTRSRSDGVPGNLICVRDKVLSQGPGGVELYEQLEPLRARTEAQLAKKPEDSEALALWGEILLDEGRRAEAIEAFRRSLAWRDDPRTRQFFRETLFEALQEDFATYQQHLGELEKVLESSEDRTRYDRLRAEGFLQIKDYGSAWQTALQLAERKDPLDRLEPMSRFHTVRGDRWVAGHLERLQAQAPAELRQQMDRQIQEQLNRALAGPDPVGQLTAFLNLYGGHPLADQARQELLSRLISGGRWLEAEMLLRQQAQSGQPETQRAAIARLAELLRRAGRPAEAAVYYQQLARQWPDAVCLDGKTGSQIVQSLPPDDPVRLALRPSRWPQGRVQVQKSPASGSSASPSGAPWAAFPSYGRFFFSPENLTDPIYPDIQIAFDQNRRMLFGYDRFGRDLWKPFPLAFGSPNQFFGFNQAWWRADLQGHLLVLSTGVHLAAYDLLGISGSEGPRQLWSLSLTEPSRLNVDEDGLVMAVFPGGLWRQMPARPGTSTIALVSDRLVCFQQLRHLTAVDTLTGKPLWQRSDLPVGCALLGDRDRLLVLPPDKTELLVLQTSDGKLVGKRPLPKLLPEQTSPAAVQTPPQLFPAGLVPMIQRADWLPAGTTNSFLREYCLLTMGTRILLWYSHIEKQKRPAQPAGEQVVLVATDQVLRLYDLWQQKDLWGPMRFPQGTRATLFEKETVGLLEPDGQLTLVRIADGQVLLKDKLDLQEFAQGLQGFYLMRLGEVYLVVPWGIPQGFQQMPQQQIPGMQCVQVPFGKVYAYNWEGKRLWPKPLELRHQNLLFSQPAGLPVVIFATQLFERRGQGGTFQVHLLAIDKQTGRKVLEEKFPYTTNIFQITGDPEKHTVNILLQRDKITLTFTDEPWPAEQPGAQEATSGKEKTAAKKPPTLREGLWRSIRKTFLPGKQPDSLEDSDDEPAGPIPVIPPPMLPLPVPVPDTR